MSANFPIQFPASRQVVWFRVLYDVLRRHNRDRDEDSLSDKGNLCYYVDRAWWLMLFNLLLVLL